MNKKAVTHVIYILTAVIPFGVALLIAVNYFGSNLVGGSIDISELNDLLLDKRLLTSPNSIIYSDNGRTYTGVVDVNKFSNEVLDSVLDLSNKQIGYKLELTNLRTHQKKVAYINKKWYDRGKGLDLPGGYDIKIKTKYVLIMDGQLDKGSLRIERVAAT